MPSPTYTPLANLTLGSSAASVSLTSISGSYRDLVLVVYGVSEINNWPTYRFNGSTSGYNSVNMFGQGSSPSSTSVSNQTLLENPSLTNMAGGSISTLNIMDYSATDKHKSIIWRYNKADSGVEAIASRWANTAAVTSIAITASGGNFNSGSTFALYGIAS